jgi:hypothetical protein
MEGRFEVVLLLVVIGLTRGVCRSVAANTEGIVCLYADELIPNPDECNQFWVCSDDLVPDLDNCINGYYFNPVNNECSPPDQVDCGTRSTGTTVTDSTTTTVSTTTANIVCVISGEIIADPTDCSAYFLCDSDLNANRNVCPNGEYFNFQDNECSPEAEVACGTRSTPGTTIITPDPLVTCLVEEEVIPDPYVCNIYWCCNSALEPVKFQCQYGENYDPSTTSCAPSDQVDCGGLSTITVTTAWTTVPQGLMCVRTGEVIPDPTDCSSFWECDSNLTATRKYCEYERYFDVSTGECADETDVDCGSRPTFAPTTPQGVICILADQEIPDPTWCNVYWVCNSDLVPVRTECKQGHYYDVTNLNCVKAAQENCGSRSTPTTPISTIAPGVVCVVSGQYIPDPTYCNLYWTCDDNLTATRHMCGTNYYFDTTQNSCLYYSGTPCSTGVIYTVDLNVTPALQE